MLKTELSVGVIILAAGESRRMGMPKPLLQWDEKTFLEIVLASPFLSRRNVHPILILGYKAKQICEKVRIPIPWELNRRFIEGRMSSIQCGLTFLPDLIQGVFIWPIDCPLVPQSVFAALLEAFHGPDAICIPRCGPRKGHPPLLGSAFFPEIQQMQPNQSLRDLYTFHADQIKTIPVESERILDNINTPEDFLTWQKRVGGILPY